MVQTKYYYNPYEIKIKKLHSIKELICAYDRKAKVIKQNCNIIKALDIEDEVTRNANREENDKNFLLHNLRESEVSVRYNALMQSLGFLMTHAILLFVISPFSSTSCLYLGLSMISCRRGLTVLCDRSLTESSEPRLQHEAEELRLTESARARCGDTATCFSMPASAHKQKKYFFTFFLSVKAKIKEKHRVKFQSISY